MGGVIAPGAPSQLVPQWLLFRLLNSSSKVSFQLESIGADGIRVLLRAPMDWSSSRFAIDLAIAVATWPSARAQGTAPPVCRWLPRDTTHRHHVGTPNPRLASQSLYLNPGLGGSPSRPPIAAPVADSRGAGLVRGRR